MEENEKETEVKTIPFLFSRAVWYSNGQPLFFCVKNNDKTRML